MTNPAKPLQEKVQDVVKREFDLVQCVECRDYFEVGKHEGLYLKNSNVAHEKVPVCNYCVPEFMDQLGQNSSLYNQNLGLLAEYTIEGVFPYKFRSNRPPFYDDVIGLDPVVNALEGARE